MAHGLGTFYLLAKFLLSLLALLLHAFSVFLPFAQLALHGLDGGERFSLPLLLARVLIIQFLASLFCFSQIGRFSEVKSNLTTKIENLEKMHAEKEKYWRQEQV